MVADQLRARGIADERVLAAMGADPARGRSSRSRIRREAYADEACRSRPARRSASRSWSRKMTEHLAVRAGRPDPRDRDRVRLPGRDPGLARGPRHVASSARPTLIPARSRPHRGARDRRSPARSRSARATAASASPTGRRGTGSSSPPRRRPSRTHSASSSRDGGRLVIPVGPRDRQLLTIVTRHGDEWIERTDGYCVFVPLIGAGGFEG